MERQTKNREYSELGFEERVAMLIDYEFNDRAQRRYERRLKDAMFKQRGIIEDVNWRARRSLEKSVILSLGGCEWIRSQQNIVFTGPTGTGKTWLACALGHRACLEGFGVKFYRISRLLGELASAKLDGSYSSLLGKVARFDVLILDDLAHQLSETERRDLAEVVEDRNGTSSLIVTSQIPVDKWPAVIGDPTLADGILDRIINRAHRIALTGPSLRGDDHPTAQKSSPSDKKNKG